MSLNVNPLTFAPSILGLTPWGASKLPFIVIVSVFTSAAKTKNVTCPVNKVPGDVIAFNCPAVIVIESPTL